uniref:Uncharacterized protein n=1 Tax=Oryza punctata TaxID=4537 RepID=A0A0E0LZR7_ORYPU
MASPRPRLPPPPRAVAPFLNGRIIRASHRLRRRGEETPVFEKDGVKFIVGNLSYDFVKGRDDGCRVAHDGREETWLLSEWSK